MRVKVIDFETTGFPATTCRITECGAQDILVGDDGRFEMEGKTLEEFVYEGDYPAITSEITELTGITQEMLEKHGISFPTLVAKLFDSTTPGEMPDYMLAHNKSFDEQVFKSEMARHRDSFETEFYARIMEIKWICSLRDIKWDAKYKCKKLSHLALDVGVSVDPATLHRAGGDVRLLIRLLMFAEIDIKALVGLSQIPLVIVRAMVPSPFGARGDGGKGKDAAKAAGFGWQKAPGTDGPELKNTWLKQVRENEIEQLRKELGYEIQIVQKA